MLEFCPLCDRNGCKRKIVLLQINLKEAVWLCESNECPWPFGYEDFTFASRGIGDAWSSEWEIHKPTVLKSTESFSTSLNELGLDTPPVTPGSGYEVVHKESVFRDTLCSVTSPNISTNNVATTKGNVQLKINANKSRRFNSRERGISSGESGEHRVSNDGEWSVQSDRSDKQDSKSRDLLNGISDSLVNKEKLSRLDGKFSLSDDRSFGNLDKCVSSSQEFVDACDAAEASTASIFNVRKPAQENLFSKTTENFKAFGDSFVNPKHESTVKCTKWLSDNTKSAVRADHSYSFDKSDEKNVYKHVTVSPQLSTDSGLRNSNENTSGTKQLPKIKSIEKANLKLIGTFAASNQKSSNRYVADLLRSSDTASSATKNEKREKSSDATETLNRTGERMMLITTDNQRNVSNKFPSDNRKAWKTSPGISKVENKTVVIDGLPPISLSYQIPSFIEEPVLPSTDIKDPGREGRVKIKPNGESAANNFSVGNNVEVDTTDCEDVGSNLSTMSGQTELKKQSMKKPLKRTIHKPTKYKGFNFDALKKKSRTNASHNRDSIKTSLLNLPSPDNVSNCSDLTYTSETSCATTATNASRSESITSTFDSSSKSISGIENFSPTVSSSDLKSGNAFSPENNNMRESNLNLDSVLDDLLFNATDALPQNLGDDWLTSLFD